MSEKIVVVVAWWNEEQIAKFLDAWGLPISEMRETSLDWLVLQRDVTREGCARTKNKGVRAAMARGAEIVVVLDDDCYPHHELDYWRKPLEGMERLMRFAQAHAEGLQPVELERFKIVTEPGSRGTPYHYDSRWVKTPVAANMGFWTGVGDYCAPGQLIHGAEKRMAFNQEAVFGKYFPLSGMNLAFRPKDWLPWCEFIDVPRFDDIWMGWLWQREAYRRGFCFNLNGPLVRHSRQSNVWQNLRDEAKHLERSETLWRDIATSPSGDYETLRKLLPV